MRGAVGRPAGRTEGKSLKAQQSSVFCQNRDDGFYRFVSPLSEAGREMGTEGREGWAQGGTYLLAVRALTGEKSPFCPLYLASAAVPP